jgi:hypothetical protein
MQITVNQRAQECFYDTLQEGCVSCVETHSRKNERNRRRISTILSIMRKLIYVSLFVAGKR